jgi:site-specific DNA-methyltransferase (adenine-specific)
MEEEVIKGELADRISRIQGESPKTKLIDSFIIKDAIEGMKALPEGCIDFTEIDPPYGIELKEVKIEMYGSNYNEIPKENYLPFVRSLLKEAYRVMAPHSWLVFWYAPEPWQELIYSEILKAGFTCSRMSAIWVKPTGQTINPEYNLANSYECFYYARKGNPSIVKRGRTNSFIFPPVLPQDKVHPTERPLPLIREIFSVFATQGMRVLVPCCGSGNSLIAAHELGMQPIGFELSKQYKDSFIVRVFRDKV